MIFLYLADNINEVSLHELQLKNKNMFLNIKFLKIGFFETKLINILTLFSLF